jgi:hypothetical protein
MPTAWPTGTSRSPAEAAPAGALRRRASSAAKRKVYIFLFFMPFFLSDGFARPNSMADREKNKPEKNALRFHFVVPGAYFHCAFGNCFHAYRREGFFCIF